MWKLSHLFIIKLSLISFLINIVLPITFIINDRIFGFEKTGSNQISFLTLSLTFNLVIVPAYSMILVSQNLNWLVMMPLSRVRLVLFSSLMRLWSFVLGVILLIGTQVLMEKFYYSNLSHYETSALKQGFAKLLALDWFVDIDWSYSTYALLFSLICVFLSGFVMNFDLESRNYKFTLSPFLFLLKSRARAIIGLVVLIVFFGFMSLSRANLFIMFSLSLPFFMYLTSNVFVLERKMLSWVKACVAFILVVHGCFIFLAREELKSDEITLERSISNFEYLEIYTANPTRLAHGILNKMIEQQSIDTYFIKSYFEELDPHLLATLISFPLLEQDLERLLKFLPRTQLDPFFFDPLPGLLTKHSSDSALQYLEFYSLRSLSTEQILTVIAHVSRAYPTTIELFYKRLSQRSFLEADLRQLLFHEDKYVVKFGLTLYRYYPHLSLEVDDLKKVMDEQPLLLEEVYKTIIVRAGEFIELSRLPLILDSLNLNPRETCPSSPRGLFQQAGDKGSYRVFTLCVRGFFQGVIQPELEQIEAIENPFYGNHLEMARSLF